MRISLFCLSGESGVRYAGDRRGRRFIAWNKSRQRLMFPNSPGSVEAALRNLPPSAVGDPNNLDAMGLLVANKGKSMEAIVEQVRAGSSLCVYLLPNLYRPLKWEEEQTKNLP